MKTFWIISIEKIIRRQSFGIRPNFEMSTNFQHPRNRYIYMYEIVSLRHIARSVSCNRFNYRAGEYLQCLENA